jgi:hypothetical protein
MRALVTLVLGTAMGFALGMLATSWYYERMILSENLLPPPITQNGSISVPGSPGSPGNDTVGRR